MELSYISWLMFSTNPGGTVAAVLIVEDDEQVRVLAESFLQGEGHATLSAATREQALALLESEEHIDLLFVALTMQDDPEAGLKLAAKAVARRPNLKVLYTSGQGVTDGMIALFVENSAFLPKPYTIDQLTATLLIKFGFGRTRPSPESCSRLGPGDGIEHTKNDIGGDSSDRTDGRGTSPVD
jgi:DNA-binding NtrC family response regulator